MSAPRTEASASGRFGSFHRGESLAPSVTPPADALLQLAAGVARLRPDWRNAEAFYEARSEIIAALRRLAHSLRAAALPVQTLPTAPMTTAIPSRAPAPVVRTPPAIPPLLPSPSPVRPRRAPMQRHCCLQPPVLPLALQPRLL